MLIYRILSAAIGIPLMLWAAYTGGAVFFLLVGLLILVGSHEYLEIVRKNSAVFPLVFYPAAILLLSSFYDPDYTGFAFFIVLTAHLLTMIFSHARVEAVGLSLFGALYIAWSLGHLILIRQTLASGFMVILLSFVITWATDTGAYFAGVKFGKHALSPLISPKKTVEGAIGGVLFCILAIMILGHFWFILPPAPLFLLAIAGSIIGQFGDLAESALKRWAGVKDSGKLIPGHGGVLDRFDSLIMVAPLVYYFIRLLSLTEVIGK